MHSLLKDLDLISNNCTADASVDLNSYELADLLYDEGNLLSEFSGWCYDECLSVDGAGINDLEDRDCEAAGFTSS